MRHAPVSEFVLGALLGNISEPRAFERCRRLVERLPAVVYRSSVLTGSWHYVSPAIEELVGLTPKEWIRHPGPWAAFVHPTTAPRPSRTRSGRRRAAIRCRRSIPGLSAPKTARVLRDRSPELPVLLAAVRRALTTPVAEAA